MLVCLLNLFEALDVKSKHGRDSMKWGALILLSLSMYGCSTPENLPEIELDEFITNESNGVSKNVDIGEINVKVTFKPSDMAIWKDVENESDPTKIKTAFDYHNQYCYFVMKLSTGGRDALYGASHGHEDFTEKLHTLSFRMKDFINITTSDKDTIQLADAYYSRIFGKGKTSDVVLLFEKERIQDVSWLSINVQEFGFDTGDISFCFNLADINNVPGLLELNSYNTLSK